MTRHVYFNTRDSGCEEFLSASLWEETDGAALSVMSAFARLGLEPWDEAERLRRLPRQSAASALVASLSRLPILVGMALPDYGAIAARLVALLPELGSIAAPRSAKNILEMGAGWWVALALGVVVFLKMNGWLF